jgi:hypothetical protein
VGTFLPSTVHSPFPRPPAFFLLQVLFTQFKLYSTYYTSVFRDEYAIQSSAPPGPFHAQGEEAQEGTGKGKTKQGRKEEIAYRDVLRERYQPGRTKEATADLSGNAGGCCTYWQQFKQPWRIGESNRTGKQYQ